MTQFDYLVVDGYLQLQRPAYIEEWLKNLGLQGWELVSVVPVQSGEGVTHRMYYFKRGTTSI